MKISLITACYNNAGVIQDCLVSVGSQTGGFELEHLIQDGGSSDGTLELLRGYRESAGYAAPVRSGPDKGFYDAINQAVSRASGDVVGLLNADDWFVSDSVLAGVAMAFKQDPDLEVVYGDLDFVRAVQTASVIGYSLLDNGEIWPGPFREKKKAGAQSTRDLVRPFWMPPDRANERCFRIVRKWRAGEFTPEKFRRGWVPPHPTVYVRRSVLERVGPYRLDMGSAADYEWLLRLFMGIGDTSGAQSSRDLVRPCRIPPRDSRTIRYIPRVLVNMRLGGQSTDSLKNRLLANKMDRRAWELNGLKPHLLFRILKPLRKLSQWNFSHR